MAKQFITVPIFTLFVFSFFVIFMLYPFWLYPAAPDSEMDWTVLSAEEFQAVIDKFGNDTQYIDEQTDFFISHIMFYRVYGGLAQGDPEKALKIFKHPDYPHNVYNMVFRAYDNLVNVHIQDPEFAQLFDEEIADIRIGTYDDGIVISVNPEYATQENFDRYESKIREYIDYTSRYIPFTFEEKSMFDIRMPSGAEFFSNPIIIMSLFIFGSSIFIVYFVKNNKI